MAGTGAPSPQLAPCGRWDGSVLVLRIRAQTRSRHPGFGKVENGELRLRLRSPPVDGKGNAEACRLLAEACGVALSRVELSAGETSRQKTFRITGPVRLPDVIIGA